MLGRVTTTHFLQGSLLHMLQRQVVSRSHLHAVVIFGVGVDHVPTHKPNLDPHAVTTVKHNRLCAPRQGSTLHSGYPHAQAGRLLKHDRNAGVACSILTQHVQHGTHAPFLHGAWRGPRVERPGSQQLLTRIGQNLWQERRCWRGRGFGAVHLWRQVVEVGFQLVELLPLQAIQYVCMSNLLCSCSRAL